MNDTENRFLWDDCKSIEEQRARVFRRWLADPDGRYDERWNNDRLLRLTIEFMIQPLLMRSSDKRLHKFWSDGITYYECLNREFTNLKFAGASMYFSNQKFGGYAPFELDLQYNLPESNIPEALSIRFGEPHPLHVIARTEYKHSPEQLRYAMAVHSRRPTHSEDWAVNLSFDPYDVG